MKGIKKEQGVIAGLIGFILLGVLACKKSQIKSRIPGTWKVIEMIYDGNSISLADTLTSVDSLDITSVREFTFNKCDDYELNGEKYCYGHMKGSYFTYDPYKKNNVVSGIVFPFIYEVKGDKIKFKVDYGSLPTISSKAEKEFEVSVKERKKKRFTLEYANAEGKVLVIKLEK